MHAESFQGGSAWIPTPDKILVARGSYPLLEAAGLTEELLDLHFVVYHSYGPMRRAALRARRELADDRQKIDYKWQSRVYDDAERAEYRGLDDDFERWIHTELEDFECAVSPDDAATAALTVGCLVQKTLAFVDAAQRRFRGGAPMPAEAAIDIAKTTLLARRAVELSASSNLSTGRKRSKEMQLQAARLAGREEPLTLCMGDPFHASADELLGCGKVFPDRMFPDARDRGPNGRMFKHWCEDHDAGQSVRRRQQLAERRRRFRREHHAEIAVWSDEWADTISAASPLVDDHPDLYAGDWNDTRRWRK